jgi:hypothetical protein
MPFERDVRCGDLFGTKQDRNVAQILSVPDRRLASAESFDRHLPVYRSNHRFIFRCRQKSDVGSSLFHHQGAVPRSLRSLCSA